MKKLRYKNRFVINGYKKGATTYDKERLPWDGCLGEVEKEKISTFLRKNLILECGIGTGRHALNFGDNYNYFGADLSSEMIKICREKTKNMDIKIGLVLSDAECLPFRSDIFDNVICSKTFKFFTFPIKFLRGAKRCLKKGGNCIVTFEVLDSFWFRLVEKLEWKVPKHENHYYIDEGITFFKKAGFSNIKIEPVANLILGIYLILWYISYPTPFSQIFRFKNSVPTNILSKLDRILKSRFLVLFNGEA